MTSHPAAPSPRLSRTGRVAAGVLAGLLAWTTGRRTIAFAMGKFDIGHIFGAPAHTLETFRLVWADGPASWIDNWWLMSGLATSLLAASFVSGVILLALAAARAWGGLGGWADRLLAWLALAHGSMYFITQCIGSRAVPRFSNPPPSWHDHWLDWLKLEQLWPRFWYFLPFFLEICLALWLLWHIHRRTKPNLAPAAGEKG